MRAAVPGFAFGAGAILPPMRTLLWLVIAGLPFTSLAIAQAPAGTDALVETLLRDWRVPGLALAVVQNGAVVHEKGYGLAVVEKKTPVTTRTTFAYGSLTKSLTTLLLHSLAAEGKLAWDKPVRDQLPGFKLSDPVASEHATPRDLVSHRTGMPRHDAMWAGLPAPPSREELVERLRFLPASASFRSTYQYNNLMFLTAGMLAAQAAGSTWEAALQARVLEPLGLGKIAPNRAMAVGNPELATSYVSKDKGWEAVTMLPGLDAIGPAGAAAGSIEELSRYLRIHMNEGKIDGRQALPEAFFRAMQTPHTPMPATGTDSPFQAQQSYGMGLFLGQYRGRAMVYHTGTIGGYHAILWWLPAEKLGVAVLLNRVERAVPHILCLTLADRMLGLPATDWNGVYKRNVAPPAAPLRRVEGTKAAHALGGYAGEYEHGGYGRVTVSESGDGLRLVRAGQTLELKHWHFDTFAAGRERVTFLTNADGAVGALRIRLEPAVAEIEFVRR